jgi:hypothetical protein
VINYYLGEILMSSMLDQAIVDAQALREAALKNAEQAVIDKYAPQIKEAVESLLESDTQEVLEEAPATEATAGAGYEIPFASDPGASGEEEVTMTMEFEFNPEDFELDLEDLKVKAEEEPTTEPEGTEALVGALGLESPDEGGGMAEPEVALQEEVEATENNEEDALIEELMSMLEEDDQIEEALKVDVGEEKHGWVTTDAGTRHYDAELELAAKQSTEYRQRADELEKEIEDLNNTILSYQTTQDKLHGAIADMKAKLEENLVMNARLLYSNRILSDASLNERQKSKIVEAVAKAKTIEEAKTIAETLKETIAGSVPKGPKSLSESVNRKSNLSHVLPRRKQQELNETLDFAGRMRKLAGID